MTEELGSGSAGPAIVLVGFAESLAAIETAWALRDAGYAVHSFARAGTTPPLAASPGIAVHSVTSPQVSAQDCVSEVIALSRHLGAEVVMPLDDDALWVCAAAHAGGLTAVVAGPTGDHAVFATDKRRQLAQARDVGFNVPRTVVIDDPAAGSCWSLPASESGWVIKPALAVELHEGRLRKPRSYAASTPEDVARHLSGATWPVLVQPVLEGRGEGVFGLALESGVAGVTGHRRLRMMNPAGSGASACRSCEVSPELRHRTQQLAAGQRWRGLLMVELLRSADGTPWFMEVNGRPWGSMALAIRREMLYPVWAVEAASGQEPAFREPGPDATCRHAGRELVHLAFVVRDVVAGRRRRDVVVLSRTVKDVLRWHGGDHLYNYRRGELRTFLRDTWQTVGHQLAAIRRSR